MKFKFKINDSDVCRDLHWALSCCPWNHVFKHSYTSCVCSHPAQLALFKCYFVQDVFCAHDLLWQCAQMFHNCQEHQIFNEPAPSILTTINLRGVYQTKRTEMAFETHVWSVHSNPSVVAMSSKIHSSHPEIFNRIGMKFALLRLQ